MPQILDRVTTNVNACAIEVAFTGTSVPSVINGWQPFYNETFTGADFQKAYAGIASIDFLEESNTSSAGVSYKQKTQFRFPATDSQRAERIALVHKIKFVKVLLNDGRVIVLGRNDIAQNTNPDIKVKSDEQLCEIEITTSSISPAGFTPSLNQFGLPVFIPLTF